MTTLDVHLTQLYPGAHIDLGAVIPETCRVDPGCYIGGEVRLGHVVLLERNVRLLGAVTLQRTVAVMQGATLVGPLEIGQEVILAAGVKVGVTVVKGEDRAAITRIGEGAHIGVNAEILGGVVLGEHCRVRAGSRVMGDVPAYGLVRGNPAVLENYICPLCSNMLVACGRVGDVYDFRCAGCGVTKKRFAVGETAFKPSHVLLPGRKSGALVSLAGYDPRWEDSLEMRSPV